MGICAAQHFMFALFFNGFFWLLNVSSKPLVIHGFSGEYVQFAGCCMGNNRY